MTFRDAAELILRDAEEALSAREITERALSRELIDTRGSTPVATMSAALYREPAGGRIQREYRPGPSRAARGSVRWRYVRAPR